MKTNCRVGVELTTPHSIIISARKQKRGAKYKTKFKEAVHGIKQHQSPRAGRGSFSGCGKIAPWEGGVFYKTTEYYKCNHIGFD